MAKKKRKSLSQDLVELAVAGAIAGPAIQVVGASGIPAPLARGTSSLIGVGLLQGAVKIGEKQAKKKDINDIF